MHSKHKQKFARFILLLALTSAITLIVLPLISQGAKHRNHKQATNPTDVAPSIKPSAPAKPSRLLESLKLSEALLEYPSRFELSAGQSATDDFIEDPDTARKRIEYLRARTHYYDIAPDALLRIVRDGYEARQVLQKSRTSEVSSGGTWTSIGPDNDGSTSSSYGAGRLMSVVPHPTLAGTLFVGAETGGVWKTTDAGSSWVSLTNDLPMLSVDSLAVAPSAPNVIYLGTGSEWMSGIGLLKSTDGGQSWILPQSVVSFRIYCISVHPTNPNELLIGTGSGVYRSTDGGVTWTQPLSQQTVYDLVRSPTNSQTVYVASLNNGTSGSSYMVYKSSDGGVTWSQKSAGLPGPDRASSLEIE